MRRFVTPNQETIDRIGWNSTTRTIADQFTKAHCTLLGDGGSDDKTWEAPPTFVHFHDYGDSIGTRHDPMLEDMLLYHINETKNTEAGLSLLLAALEQSMASIRSQGLKTGRDDFYGAMLSVAARVFAIGGNSQEEIDTIVDGLDRDAIDADDSLGFSRVTQLAGRDGWLWTIVHKPGSDPLLTVDIPDSGEKYGPGGQAAWCLFRLTALMSTATVPVNLWRPTADMMGVMGVPLRGHCGHDRRH